MIIAAACQAPQLEIFVSAIAGSVANGTSVTATATAEGRVFGGIPPYTYAWTEGAANFSFTDGASVTSRIQVTGTNVNHDVTIVWVVTDAAGFTATASSLTAIVQGTPP